MKKQFVDSIINKLKYSKALIPFVGWFRQVAINLHFMAPSGNLAKNRREHVKAFFFLFLLSSLGYWQKPFQV